MLTLGEGAFFLFGVKSACYNAVAIPANLT
jgi:hypothetical protein